MSAEQEIDITKSIDFKRRIFKGSSGKIYRIETDYISCNRYKKYLEYAPLVMFGISTRQVFNLFRKIYEFSTDGESMIGALHQVSTHAYYGMQLTKELSDPDRHDAMLWMNALFCNYEGEDTGKWKEAEMMEKVRDFGEINMLDMEKLAASLSTGLRGALKDFKKIEDQIKTRGLDHMYLKAISEIAKKIENLSTE